MQSFTQSIELKIVLAFGDCVALITAAAFLESMACGR